jgi:hypothetical protein
MFLVSFIYTGIKINFASINSTRWKLSFSLGQYTTVLQAEGNAIKACMVENLDRNYRNKKHLYSLSQQSCD